MKAKTAIKKSTMKPGSGKTWTDKVNDPSKKHVVKKLDKDFADMSAGCKMLIATPAIIDAYVRQIPRGKSSTLKTLRQDLATEYRADYTCPVTSGIFLRIVAEAAHEQWKKGAPLKSIAPFWRIVEETSPLNNKFSFGATFVKTQRKREGILSEEKAKKMKARPGVTSG
jgi:hypothetical protein